MDEPAITQAATSLLELIETGTLSFDCNDMGVPYIKQPTREGVKVWALSDSRTRGWLTRLVFKSTKHVLTETEVVQLIRILEGAAFENGTDSGSEARIWDLVEQEPVIRALLRFSNENASHSDGAEAFLGKLTRFAATQRMSGVSTSKWPSAANIFTYKLRKFEPYFETLGISVNLKRNKDGCRVSLQRLNSIGGGSIVTSSSLSTSETPQESKGPRSDVAGDDSSEEEIHEILANHHSSVFRTHERGARQ